MGSESNPEGRIGWEREKDRHVCIMLGAGQDRDRLEASFLTQRVYGIWQRLYDQKQDIVVLSGNGKPFLLLVWLVVFVF